MRHNTLRTVLWAAFALYVLTLVYLLFLSPAFGRTTADFVNQGTYLSRLRDFIRWRSNFVPFRTIAGYIRGIGIGFSLRLAAINLLGNLAAFTPMGFFLPVLFKSLRRFLKFFLLLLGMLVLVEVSQLLLLVGSCDIDDIILNAAGAAAVWWLFKIPPLRRRVEKM
ncbi:MAG: VanZ family protein [Firmicutes bacterium]|nr:VanZ family protein [Bacillota bacterium]